MDLRKRRIFGLKALRHEVVCRIETRGYKTRRRRGSLPFQGVGWLIRACLGLQSDKRQIVDRSQSLQGSKWEQQPLLLRGKEREAAGASHKRGSTDHQPPSFSILHLQKLELDSDLGSQKYGRKRRGQENLPLLG